MTLLIAYASVHGSTEDMAVYLATVLNRAGLKTESKPIAEIQSLDGYEAVILGSPVHAGMWVPAMQRFLHQFYKPLSARSVYAWLTCMRVLEEGGYDHARKYYIASELETMPHVRSIEIFPGRIIPADLTWQEHSTLNNRYDGAYNVTYVHGDYRDWVRFQEWGQFIARDVVAQSDNFSA